jgi:hypothetical protein
MPLASAQSTYVAYSRRVDSTTFHLATDRLRLRLLRMMAKGLVDVLSARPTVLCRPLRFGRDST